MSRWSGAAMSCTLELSARATTRLDSSNWSVVPSRSYSLSSSHTRRRRAAAFAGTAHRWRHSLISLWSFGAKLAVKAALDDRNSSDCRLGTLRAQSAKLEPNFFGLRVCRSTTVQR